MENAVLIKNYGVEFPFSAGFVKNVLLKILLAAELVLK